MRECGLLTFSWSLNFLTGGLCSTVVVPLCSMNTLNAWDRADEEASRAGRRELVLLLPLLNCLVPVPDERVSEWMEPAEEAVLSRSLAC